MEVIPTPLGLPERERGYWWELSMRQVKVSRTLVFDAPGRARGFVESLITDNMDLGRPRRGPAHLRPSGAQEHQGHLFHQARAEAPPDLVRLSRQPQTLLR